MFGLSPTKLLLLVLVLVVLFGAKRIPRLATDLGKGIRALGKSLRGEEDETPGDDRRT